MTTNIATPEQIARECLTAAHNNRERAIALAGKRARGAKLRAVVRAIGNEGDAVFLRTKE